jgi:hypothetical protein
MRFVLPAVALTALLAMTTPADDKKDTRVYEMRVYYAEPGKLDALNARFRDHTMKLFAKHGMTNVGYFVPVGENKDNKLVYFLAYPSKDAAAQSWKAFGADPDWKKAKADSEKDGKLVKKAVSTYLSPTDYSPELKIGEASAARVFELRTYTATKGNLPTLDARFRDHTMKLFEKHGMRNLAYWHPLPDQKGADNTLIYLLAHQSPEAAKASFDAFRKDPAWVAAKAESEKKAGGSLTEAEGGVVSEFLKPTDYSPLK